MEPKDSKEIEWIKDGLVTALSNFELISPSVWAQAYYNVDYHYLHRLKDRIKFGYAK